ncbi:MAG TPA: hypothetical protein VG013_20805 [Gemmataceae bacterium]|nr:hypothetical protein [Gemmataceae bacterium]
MNVRPSLLVGLSLALACLVLGLCLARPSAGQAPAVQAKPDDLATRVQQLEQRLAALEKILKQAQPKEATKSATETKLVGNWMVSDRDRKVEGIVTDLKLKADGTGKAVVNTADGRWNNMKYDVVGKHLQLKEERGHASYELSARLQSVTDTEMMLEYTLDDKPRRVHYTRDK